MFRHLIVENARRLGEMIFLKQKDRESELQKHVLLVLIGSKLHQCRCYCHCGLSNRGFISHTWYNVKKQYYKSYFSRKYSIVSSHSPSSSSSSSNHAQFAWKLSSNTGSSKDSIFPRIGRAAQAVTLALTRTNFLVPGVFAFTCGHVALTHPTLVESDHFFPHGSLYIHAHEGHAYITTIVSAIVECFLMVVRALYLAILLSPSLMMGPFSDCCGPKFREMWLCVVHRTLERAGPAFIKWGQWAATRPDLFPRDLCTKLSQLHSKSPEHSFAYTKRSIEAAFGRKLSEIFDGFEEVPVASGSIAQVHRASLKFRYPNQKQVKPVVVAVKVRHPGVGESIRRDFVIINLLAKISKFIPALSWLRLDEGVQQFAVFMMSQVDLAREAAHLNRFLYNFRKWKNVSFPKPVFPFIHPAVLVESYEHGESVSRYLDERQGPNRVKTALAHIGTHALLKMLLVDNFIHADMHPGNILVRVARENLSQRLFFKKNPHIIFLDVGMTAELSRSDRGNLVDFFKAVARRDGRTAAECTLRLSKQQNCPNPTAFIEEVEESFTFWGSPEGDAVHPAECMQQLLEKVRRHRVNIDASVCTVIVTTLVLEGWQRKLDPNYNVMHTLQSLLLRADWAKSLSYTIDGLMAP